MPRSFYALSFLSLLAFFSGSSPALATETVKLQLKWEHQFQFAGYYAAKHLGYYRDAGLEVDIISSKPGVDAVDVVLQGDAEYGVGSSGLLLARNAGIPVVVLAVIMQHSPFVLLARQESTLNGIQGLAGKHVMIEPMGDEIIALLNHQGLSVDSFVQLLENPHNLDAFVNGDVDAIDAYITDEPYELMVRGVPFNIFQPRSAGIDFYGDNLFTTENELNNHPERVRRFREASLKGWRYAMAHPDKIIELIIDQYPTTLDRKALIYEAQQMQQLVHPELIDIGYMLEKRWRHIAGTYAELGMLPQDLSLDGFLYEEQHEPDLFWFYTTTAITLLILSIVILINVRFSRLNHQLSSLLHIQSRFANIGESVNNISHQWKQPLNELAIQLMLLEQLASDTSLPERAKSKIKTTTAKSHSLLEFMAKTVESFSHLMRTGRSVAEFSPSSTVEEVIDLIKDTFQLHKISVSYTSHEDTYITGNSTEFAHVILSILNNARDTVDERGVDPALITIVSYRKPGYFCLEIGDNAGGIRAQPIDRIFNLGFSEKQSANSGVGLYIAKKIIVDSFKGSITAQNTFEGAIFTIGIPCSDQ